MTRGPFEADYQLGVMSRNAKRRPGLDPHIALSMISNAGSDYVSGEQLSQR